MEMCKSRCASWDNRVGLSPTRSRWPTRRFAAGTLWFSGLKWCQSQCSALARFPLGRCACARLTASVQRGDILVTTRIRGWPPISGALLKCDRQEKVAAHDAGGSIHQVVGDANWRLEEALESPGRALITARTQPCEPKPRAWKRPVPQRNLNPPPALLNSN